MLSASEQAAYDKNAYYALKFGPAGVPAFTARVEREAAALGLGRLSFAGRVGDTRDSHLLLLLAQGRGPSSLVAAKLQDALFRGEFHEGRDVSDRAFLLEAVRGVGMLGDDGDGEAGMLREAELVAWLDSEGARAMVDGMERRAKTEVGIVAVPSFVVQGRYRVGGKQEEGVFLELFERIRRAEVEDLGKAEIIESAEGLGEGERC